MIRKGFAGPTFLLSKKSRLLQKDIGKGPTRIVPDFVVEVISPNVKASEVDEKIDDYFTVGVRLIWIINPEARTVLIHRADGTTTRLKNGDEISGEDVISGFRCKVSEFFP